MFSKFSNFSGPFSAFSHGTPTKLLLSLDSYFYDPYIYSTTFTFDDLNSYGVTYSSNSATSIGSGGWVTYIRSVESYSGKIKLKFKKTNRSMCGFSDMSDGGTYTNINYGFYFQQDYVTIAENKASGVPGNPAIWEIYQIPGPYLPSSFYSVIYDGTSVKYYIDDVLVYTSIYSPLPTNPLYLYMTFLDSGASLTNIEFGAKDTINTYWNDISGNGNNFELQKSPIYENGSIYFNSSNGQYATGKDLGDLNKFTIDTWFNLKSLPNKTNPQIITNIFDNSNPGYINFALGFIDDTNSSNL